MAITLTELIGEGSATNWTGSFTTTATATPTGDREILVFVTYQAFSGSITSGTLSGQGITWEKVADVVIGTNRRGVLFRGSAASPSNGALTFTLDTSATAIRRTLHEAEGNADVALDAIVQSATNSSDTAASAGDVTLASFADATNNAAVLFLWKEEDAGEITPDASLTQVGADVAAGTENGRSIVAYVVGEDTSPGATWAGTAVDWLAIAIELDAAATGITGSGSPTQAAHAAAGSGNHDAPAFTATGTPTQAAQTSTGSGAFTDPPSGSGATTQTDQTSTATGNFDPPTFTATGTPSQAAQTAAATGNFDPPTFAGTGTPTEAADTASAVGNYDPAPITGTAGPTQADQTATASGLFDPPGSTGTASPSQDAQTASAVGNYTPPPITGTAASTEATDTATGAGLFDAPGVAGTGAPTQDAQISTAVGNYDPAAIGGTGGPTEAADTATAAGNFDQPVFTGTVAASQANHTSTAVGAFSYSVSGDGTPSQADQTPTGVGVLTVTFDDVRRVESAATATTTSGSLTSSSTQSAVTATRTEGALT